MAQDIVPKLKDFTKLIIAQYVKANLCCKDDTKRDYCLVDAYPFYIWTNNVLKQSYITSLLNIFSHISECNVDK